MTVAPPLELRTLRAHVGGLALVDDVDLELAPASTTALIGPNGAGKTSLLRVVAGLLAPSAGRVLAAGVDVTGWAPHRVRRAGVATLRQRPRPLAGHTVRADVAVGAMFGDRDGPRDEAAALAVADEALALVDLADRGHAAATALDPAGRRALELARALAGRPRVLLLDEPLAGLDPGGVEDVLRLLGRLRRAGLALLWVEHHPRAVRSHADHVVVLDRGRVLAAGAPAVVMDDPAVAAAYLGRPASGAA